MKFMKFTYINKAVKHGQYLGFCEEKGYVYSVLHKGIYHVVAVKNGGTECLITYTC